MKNYTTPQNRSARDLYLEVAYLRSTLRRIAELTDWASDGSVDDWERNLRRTMLVELLAASRKASAWSYDEAASPPDWLELEWRLEAEQ